MNMNNGGPPSNYTPNVRIEDPKVRKIVGDALGWAGVAITATVLVDLAIPAIDIAWFTTPAAAINLGFLGLFQGLITSPNVPKS